MIHNENLFDYSYNCRNELPFATEMFKESIRNCWGSSELYAIFKNNKYFVFNGRQRILCLKSLSESDFKKTFTNGISITLFNDMPPKLALSCSYSYFKRFQIILI